MLSSLLSSDKQAHIPVYLVKSLTVLHMHVQAQCCFYKIENNSYSHIFLMRESSHQPKCIWLCFSCKTPDGTGACQLLVLSWRSCSRAMDRSLLQCSSCPKTLQLGWQWRRKGHLSFLVTQKTQPQSLITEGKRKILIDFSGLNQFLKNTGYRLQDPLQI